MLVWPKGTSIHVFYLCGQKKMVREKHVLYNNFLHSTCVHTNICAILAFQQFFWGLQEPELMCLYLIGLDREFKWKKLNLFLNWYVFNPACLAERNFTEEIQCCKNHLLLFLATLLRSFSRQQLYSILFFLRVKKSTRCNITKYMVWQSLSCSRIPAEFLLGTFLWWPAIATGGDKPHHCIPFVQDKDLGSVAGKSEWSWIVMLSMNIQESWIFMLSCTLGEWETEARDIWEEQSDWGAEWEDQRADWAKSEVRSERIWCVCVYKGYLAYTHLGITGGCPFSRMEMFWFFFLYLHVIFSPLSLQGVSLAGCISKVRIYSKCECVRRKDLELLSMSMLSLLLGDILLLLAF